MSIVINGGGIIGTILALMLAKLTKGSLEISLIEQYSPYFFDVPSYTKRPKMIVLSRGAYAELVQMDIDSILSTFSTVVTQLEISEHDRLNTILIKSQDYQLSELGYVIDLHVIRKQLFNLLCKQSIVTVYCPATIQHIKREQFCNIITLNNGKKITAKLMVAANGLSSVLSTNFGIQWYRWNYRQIAITTEISTEIPHCGKAFEQFTEFGSLALLPMTNNVSFLVWCVSDAKRTEIIAWDKNKFSQELQNIFGWKLGKILGVKTRYFYDIWLIYAKHHIAHRLALVGNAAQSLHPIAGQGFNLGMRDVVTLVKIIFQALSDHIDIGEYSVLSLYQNRRKLDQYRTIAITDGLVRVFGNKYLPLIIIRNLGLLWMSRSAFLKNLLVNSMLFWKTS